MSLFRWPKKLFERSEGQDDNSLKTVVVRRAMELGSRIDTRDVTVSFMDAEVARGCWVFHAWWGAGEARQSLSGLIKDDEEPDTYPAQALGKIFQRWFETEGKLPDARHIAAVSAYIYDASDLHKLILSDEDKEAFVNRPEWLRYITLPEQIDVSGQPGVKFWRIGPRGASELRIFLSKNGQICTEEVFIQDLLRHIRKPIGSNTIDSSKE